MCASEAPNANYTGRDQGQKSSFPTKQLAEILEPLRHPAHRAVAKRISDEWKTSIWLRTGYSNEEKHQAFIEEGIHERNFVENMEKEGIILSDRPFYNWGDQWRRILDHLPEILHPDLEETNQKFVSDKDLPERYFDMPRVDATISYGVMSPEEYDVMTCRVHNACSTQLVLVEDTRTSTGDEPSFDATWLDDRGTSVRTTRMSAQDVRDYLSDATYGCISCESSELTFATIGPGYLAGEVRGPSVD